MARFTLPRDIYYGVDAIEMLSTLRGTRAIIVVGCGAMRRFGFVERAERLLRLAGMDVGIVENIESDPSVQTAVSGAAAMSAYNPDWIVAMGGGSTIDAAKLMWVFYEYPEASFGALTVPFGFPQLRQKARFVAIPSTSGAASEVSAFSVITDPKSGYKYPLIDYNITPDIAIIDPSLAVSMPKALAASTGMDALSHAVEAYVSVFASAFTDPLATSALRLIFKALQASSEGDRAARDEMHYAQCLAGMAFSNANLGIAHAMANKTGTAFSVGNLAHGCLSALYLPYAMAYNAKDERALSRYADIARETGSKGRTNAGLAAALKRKIAELSARLGMPQTLKSLGVDEQEFKAKLPAIATAAADDPCTLSNPRGISVTDMGRLLTCAYYGSEVNF